MLRHQRLESDVYDAKSPNCPPIPSLCFPQILCDHFSPKYARDQQVPEETRLKPLAFFAYRLRAARYRYFVHKSLFDAL